MSVGDDVLNFYYDSGASVLLTNNGTTYYYITNLQGDVTSIVDGTGAVVAEYEYDPYGNIISATGELAEVNPLRYRGYIYDQECDLYYLQSRYYDAKVGRFLNADALASTGQGILGNNMFAYCLNNPGNMVDPTGHCCVIWGYNLWDCGECTCRDSANYDPDPPRAAIIYDARDSGFLRLKGKGFKDHGSIYAMALKTSHDVEEYPFTDMDEFVEAWNSLSGEYDRVIIMAHGYDGGMSCNGASISNSSKEDYDFGDLNPVPVVTVYLFTCNGATIDAKGNSVAMIFAYLTSGNVWAVYNGRLSYDYWTLMPYPTEGGIWSVTKGTTTTIKGG